MLWGVLGENEGSLRKGHSPDLLMGSGRAYSSSGIGEKVKRVRALLNQHSGGEALGKKDREKKWATSRAIAAEREIIGAGRILRH